MANLKRKKVEKIELVDTKLLKRLREEEPQLQESESIGIHRLIKNDLFLGLLLVTFINALIFVYYEVSKQDWISNKDASAELIVFSDRVPGVSKIKTIADLQGKFYTKESPEFQAATRNLNLDFDQFHDAKGGVIFQSVEPHQVQ